MPLQPAAKILAAILLVIGAAADLAAMGWFQREPDGWQRLVFDGREFRPVSVAGGMSVWVRNGFLPVKGSVGVADEGKRLPSGFGAVAGYCFVQETGGKLGGTESWLPLAGVAVRIVGEGLAREATADEDGFFVVVLPPGDYEVQARAGRGWVTVATAAGAERFVPVHHSTFKLSDEPLDEPLARLEAALAKEQGRLALRRTGETAVLA